MGRPTSFPKMKDISEKIISIHKSKGLEFPVVFVSGLGKQFNQQDARASLVMHPDLGVGADWVDAKYRTKTPTLLKKAVQRQIQIENLGGAAYSLRGADPRKRKTDSHRLYLQAGEAADSSGAS